MNSRTEICIALFSCAVACGGIRSRTSSSTLPTLSEQQGLPPSCTPARDPLNPLIVEWPAANKVDLDSRSRRGIVVVSYVGCVLKVLSNCDADGSYELREATPARDRLIVEDESKLLAELPLGVASLRGDLAQGKRLELSYLAVGQRAAVKAPTALSGECAGATHWVRTMTVGAYALEAVAKDSAGAGVSALGAKVDGEFSALRSRRSAAGDLEACEATRGKGEGCGAILRLGLAALVPASPQLAGFGDGLAPIPITAVIQPLPDLSLPGPGLAGADVALLHLLQAAKRAEKDNTSDSALRAQAWGALAEYRGNNPYRFLAEERSKAWIAVGQVEAQRRELAAQVCVRHASDKHKLAQLMSMDNDVVPQPQKQAYLREFATTYSPWQSDIQRCERQAEVDRLSGPMVLIPGGRLRVSGDARGESEISVQSFSLDAREVTVAAYDACLKAHACTEPTNGGYCNWGSDRKSHPINCVDWYQAIAFCRWAGKRLPTEEEWEYAARGQPGRTYPWGNSGPYAQLCWNSFTGTCQAGNHRSGDTPQGVQDLAGNVWEWTGSHFSDGNPARHSDDARSVRGGGWDGNNPSNYRGTTRRRLAPATRLASTGFRCAR